MTGRMLALALVSSAIAAPPGWTLLPFGVGVYLHGKPVRGAVYSATQAAGLGVLAYSTAKGYEAAEAEDDATFYLWQNVSIAAVTVAAASYAASVIDGSRLHELETAATARATVMSWDLSRARGETLAELPAAADGER